MQIPSAGPGVCCCNSDCGSCVQPSGQQMPSIAFNEANSMSIDAATSLCTG
jgi:hypothetical protein